MKRLALAFASLFSFAATALPAGQIQFEDIASDAGVNFTLRNSASGRFHQIELMVAGVAAFDYNNDGCQDIYFINGAAIPSLEKEGPDYHNRLFRNNCDLTFTDVTETAGVAGKGYSMAVATADYDNDGWADIFVAGVNHNTLYRNLGNGRFEDVTKKAGLEGIHPDYGKMWAISAGWFDYDNDGWLDLFISNYVQWDLETEPQCDSPDTLFYCHPDVYEGLPDQLYRNNGDGTFTDVSEQTGLLDYIGKGMGVAFADFNGDGFTDVFVANDSVPHFLFENLAGERFQELALEAGVAVREDGAPIAGMGVDFRDFDNDGRPDVVISGMINDTFQLFRNTGDELMYFEDQTAHSGLAVGTRSVTGWSLGMYDLDNDGWKDLFFASSHFPDSPYVDSSLLANRLFRNLGNGRFEDVTRSAGPDFQKPALHHGSAFADFDNDGRIDVAGSVLNGPAKLFHNITPDAGNWLALRLEGVASNRNGIGAEVTVTLPGGKRLVNHVTTSVGYASSSELPVRFGLGEVTEVERVRIRWPSGRVQELDGVLVNRLVEVREPEKGKGTPGT